MLDTGYSILDKKGQLSTHYPASSIQYHSVGGTSLDYRFVYPMKQYIFISFFAFAFNEIVKMLQILSGLIFIIRIFS